MDAPGNTKSFALIVDDPDAPDPAAPKRVWVHWILYDIPPGVHALKEGIKDRELPPGTRQGLTDGNRAGYGGPCPPVGRHRYFFRLYALDVQLGDLGTPRRKDLDRAMQHHVLGEAVLMGTYKRTRR
jgi:Raf kinase inhibitor-like YbhB/YbcL family protein